MLVIVNGKQTETKARTLADLVAEQALSDNKVATAVNGSFIAIGARAARVLNAGDRIEIVSPRQGG